MKFHTRFNSSWIKLYDIKERERERYGTIISNKEFEKLKNFISPLSLSFQFLLMLRRLFCAIIVTMVKKKR